VRNARSSYEKGFTLIEVIVVVAIVAIMTGVMVPMVYRIWESNDAEATRDRMRTLKVALVGDSRMVQNGVRTSYGYAGDVGQLPANLDALIADDGSPNWHGPYVPPGYDPSTYAKDAWGRAIEYTTTPDGLGRRVTASLRSNGPDGAAATGDDIVDTDLQVYQAEVTPLIAVQGNVNILFASAPTLAKNYYIGVSAQYKDRAGVVLATSSICCNGALAIAANAGNTQVNYVQNFACTPANALPVGRLYVSPRLFSDINCQTGVAGTPIEIASDVNTASVFANLQIQSVVP